MRILTITPRLTEHAGGDGLYAFHLNRGLTEAGHDASVLTLIDSHFVLIRSSSPDENGQRKMTEVNFGERQHDFFHENFFSHRAAQALKRSIETVQPEIIHIHGIHQYFTASCISVLRSAGIPIVYTMHDYKLFCGNSGFFSDHSGEQCTLCLNGGFHHPLIQRCKKNSLPYSAATAAQMGVWSLNDFLGLITVIHAPSRYVGTLLRTNAVIKERIVVERHPVLFSASAAPQPERPLSILFFGRMVPHKGAHLVAEAVRGIEIPVHFIGSGPELERVKTLTAGNRMVSFHGWKTQEEIRAFMGEGTIAVLPYLAPETFCFAVLEAMIEGCTVITSGQGAIPELVRHRVNGMIVDPPMAEGFRDALNEVVKDAKLRKNLSAQARSAGSELLSVRDHAERIAQLYQSIL